MPFDTAPKLGMTAINGSVRFESFAADINSSVFMILPVIICDPLNNSGTQNANAKIVVSGVIIFLSVIDIAFSDIRIPFLTKNVYILIISSNADKFCFSRYYPFVWHARRTSIFSRTHKSLKFSCKRNGSSNF